MSDESQPPKSQPPKEMSLSVEQLDAVSDHINRIVGGPEKDTCPVCNSFHNLVESFVFQVPVGYDQQVLGIGRHAPAYITTCQKCGFTRLFNKNVVDKAIAEASVEPEL